MSLFNQTFPVLMGTGNLPLVFTNLVVEGVTNRSGGALAVGNVVQFDMHGSQAESTDQDATSPKLIWATGTSSTGSSVFSNVCFAPTVSATLRSLSCAVFGVVKALRYNPSGAAGADNATVDVTVIGEVQVVKAASATHARGDTFIPVAGAATVAVTSGTLTAAKIVAIATDNRSAIGTGTPTNAGTTLWCMFNGYGFGWN